ncbi:transglycosylase domain-containing protein [Thermodesulfobacteriota bacterium]
MKKLLKKFLYISAFLLAVLLLAVTSFFFYVRSDVDNQIERGAIEKVIFSESPVYYDDGITPIGVYFEKQHSKYVKYNDIPKIYIKALIASEDHDFFTHPGFDIKGIIRASIANLKAGRIVQGGSTLSQQTAENVFRREKRGFVSQLKELFRALILEHTYTKEEILEMYVNQFDVTGFGKGFRIASEYFFDKDPDELNLVEAAFIAGMVKGPSKYNPFTKNTEEKKKLALKNAKTRKNYVIKNMLKLNMITADEYLEAIEKEIPFKEGKVTYKLNVVLDYVRQQLESEYFDDVLYNQGIDNIATSGIKIYTSISNEMQDTALKSVRNNLPLLDIRLSGFDPGLYKERYIQKAGTYYTNQKSGLPFFARIDEINLDGEKTSMTMSWDNGEAGILNYQGMKKVCDTWAQWNHGYNYRSNAGYIDEFIKVFNEGDYIPVTLVDPDKKLLELSPVPELEGGVIILKDGMIKAMVGGYFNRHFNRASDAKRQLGSIFKPIIYAAALQLKWHSLDKLFNIEDLFTFENTYYMPNPDHEPQSEEVSMAWAGVKSENLATVWLLYHLTDRLNMGEFRQIAEILGLNRGNNESYHDYAVRIRDKHGVIVNTNAIRKAAFDLARKSIESDLLFDDNLTALETINRLHFSIDASKLDIEGNNTPDFFRYDFKRLTDLNSLMKEELEDIKLAYTLYADNPSALSARLKKGLDHLYLIDSGTEKRIAFLNNPPTLNGDNYKKLTLEDLLESDKRILLENIWIDDLVPSGIIDNLHSYMGYHFKELTSYSRYDIKVLSHIRDFKTLVNLMYVRQLAHDMGISTWLDPVLSFPLGPNSISILEGALAYQTIMQRTVNTFGDEFNSSMVPIIKRITDRDGETIWEYSPEKKEVLTKEISSSVTESKRGNKNDS